MEITVEQLQELLKNALASSDTSKMLTTVSQFRNQYIEIMRANRPQCEKIIDRGINKGKKIFVDAPYVKSIEYTFEKFIDFVGDVLLSQVDVIKAEKFILTSFKKAPHIAAQHLRNLRAAFNRALNYELIKSNPFLKVKLPKIQKNPPAWVDSDEMKKILEHVPEKLKIVYLFLFYTGLRAGELVNLTWRGVNIKDRYLIIGMDFITKTKSSRVIPINYEVQKILAGLYELQNKKHSDEKLKDRFVFTKRSGYKFTVDYLSREWKKAVRASGADERLHLHSLRHSAASNLVSNGANLYSVKNILGHSTIETTQQYTHLNISSLRKTVDEFSSIVHS